MNLDTNTSFNFTVLLITLKCIYRYLTFADMSHTYFSQEGQTFKHFNYMKLILTVLTFLRNCYVTSLVIKNLVCTDITCSNKLVLSRPLHTLYDSLCIFGLKFCYLSMREKDYNVIWLKFNNGEGNYSILML